MLHTHRLLTFVGQGLLLLFGQCLHRLILVLAFGLAVVGWFTRKRQARLPTGRESTPTTAFCHVAKAGGIGGG